MLFCTCYKALGLILLASPYLSSVQESETEQPAQPATEEDVIPTKRIAIDESLRDPSETLEQLLTDSVDVFMDSEIGKRVQQRLDEIRGIEKPVNLVWLVWTVAGLVPVGALLYFRFRS